MPAPHRKLSYSDLDVTPDDGSRHELISGELFVTASPGTLHQRVSGRLYLQLVRYCAEHASGEVFYAPTDVILTDHDVFVPDLFVVANPADVSERGIEGPPLLVVEILSPSSVKHDRVVKARRYAQLGVRHYWIVDPAGRSVSCDRLAGDRYERVVEVSGDGTLAHPDWEGLAIDLARIWAVGPG